ncbi:hypothetical protein SUGI_0706530 [Cryptomeria japonica]|uniref:tRNA (cytosine(38)-C(5))-methyltransferase 2 isoform X2 n=1 Tax=Cryptomeria japonica TaxID=3369 RepID=UPI002414728B|nr:tRNA (cytosine(38)-C(5))-methyltransferase 2 isoform X2 [Cryptomeria japonica]GLJ35107.1 hypothetical protein SUGI_0706530 [Cryptomeria japonica]
MEEGGDQFRVLEFYSGIGGMRFSLKQSRIHATVVEAFDINNIANEVYKHNFGHSPCQRNIQSLTAAQLDNLKAHAWLLSPPCQPYTRQGLQKDAEDARAYSFLKIIELIPSMLYPPTKLFVENVVGFESSITHKQLMEVLVKTGFTTQEFILSPLQFGVPYSRPRYFCLAKKMPLSFPRPEFNGKLVSSIWPLITGRGDTLTDSHVSLNAINENEVELDSHALCRPIKDFLEFDSSRNNGSSCIEMDSSRTFCENITTVEVGNDFKDYCTKQGFSEIGEKEILVHSSKFCSPEDYDYNGATAENGSYISNKIKDNNMSSKWDQYRIPVSLIERWGDAMDIVFPDSTRCCCFTKSYSRYVKGTGSFLATAKDNLSDPPTKTDDERQGEQIKSTLLQELDLRYFTPREISNLHSFPGEFEFPDHVSLRQRYALLGNSLSVAVVAPLLKYLFTD